MSVGAFIAGFGFIYSQESKMTLFIAAFGLAMMFGCMLIHSLHDDAGHYVTPDELKGKKEARVK